jgi:hypothetical protein
MIFQKHLLTPEGLDRVSMPQGSLRTLPSSPRPGFRLADELYKLGSQDLGVYVLALHVLHITFPVNQGTVIPSVIPDQ